MCNCDWTQVSERLPKVGREVLIELKSDMVSQQLIYLAHLSDHHHLHFHSDEYDFELSEVAYWREIPYRQPKEEQDGK
jgi:hypothetical protein